MPDGVCVGCVWGVCVCVMVCGDWGWCVVYGYVGVGECGAVGCVCGVCVGWECMWCVWGVCTWVHDVYVGGVWCVCGVVGWGGVYVCVRCVCELWW